MITCPNCNTQNTDYSVHCIECGALLRDPNQAAASPKPSQESAPPQNVEASGGQKAEVSEKASPAPAAAPKAQSAPEAKPAQPAAPRANYQPSYQPNYQPNYQQNYPQNFQQAPYAPAPAARDFGSNPEYQQVKQQKQKKRKQKSSMPMPDGPQPAEPPHYIRPIGYILYNILFSIPLIGLIMLIIFSVSDKKINRRNYARSFLLVILITLILGIVLAIVLFATGAVDAIKEQLLDLLT